MKVELDELSLIRAIVALDTEADLYAETDSYDVADEYALIRDDLLEQADMAPHAKEFLREGFDYKGAP